MREGVTGIRSQRIHERCDRIYRSQHPSPIRFAESESCLSVQIIPLGVRSISGLRRENQEIHGTFSGLFRRLADYFSQF